MYGTSATKVAASKAVEVMTIVRSTPPTSERRSVRVSSAVTSRCASPIRRITDRLSRDATVSTPSPPTFIASMITVSPKGDQCTAVSTVTSPVTQIAETAVNRASTKDVGDLRDRKSTRLNSSHVAISYAVLCLKKKTNEHT